MQSDFNPARVDFLQLIFVQSDTQLCCYSKVNLLRSHRWLVNGYRIAYNNGTIVVHNSGTIMIQEQYKSGTEVVRNTYRCKIRHWHTTCITTFTRVIQELHTSGETRVLMC